MSMIRFLRNPVVVLDMNPTLMASTGPQIRNDLSSVGCCLCEFVLTMVDVGRQVDRIEFLREKYSR
jgi:hypothetical protein